MRPLRSRIWSRKRLLTLVSPSRYGDGDNSSPFLNPAGDGLPLTL